MCEARIPRMTAFASAQAVERWHTAAAYQTAESRLWCWASDADLLSLSEGCPAGSHGPSFRPCGRDQDRCSWQTEPGEYRWLLTRAADRLEVTILRFGETFSRQRDA